MSTFIIPGRCLVYGFLKVIIGSNGSGKCTILKVIARIYDPTEASVLVDGQVIKTLRLADLRRAARNGNPLPGLHPFPPLREPCSHISFSIL
jgi:ABC-type phosphonate transport system ATPase subunit